MYPSESIKLIMQLAAHEAVISSYGEIHPEHLLLAIFQFAGLDRSGPARAVAGSEGLQVRTILSSLKIDFHKLRADFREQVIPNPVVNDGMIHRTGESRQLFVAAGTLAAEENLKVFGSIHLLKAILARPTSIIAQQLESGRGATDGSAKTRESNQSEQSDQDFSPEENIPALAALVGKLRRMRKELQERVLGQDYAIGVFMEGLFNAEVFARADTARKGPLAVFVFAGPPGVGKTLLAETGAEVLGRPLRRFDMSGYSGHEEVHSLLGIHKSYKDAHAGLLTGFVKENPDAILLFDEIEKAHLNTIHFFLQILDAGRLEDKYTEEIVDFGGTVIIFTTNAGRLLYEEPNRTGVQLSGAARYNRAILDALGKDIDPRTGNPFFPAALLSRMGSGYPVMFNHLGINELEKVCVDALQRSGKLLEKTFFMPVEFDPLVSLCLLLGQGVDLDARTLTARAEAFVKEEIYHLSLLYHSDRLEELFRDSEKIIFTVEQSRRGSTFLDEFTGLKRRPEVLLVTDSSLRETWCAGLNEVEWSFSDDPLEVCGIIESREIDMVLLDLWTGENAGADGPEAENRTLMQFDYVPGAARGIARGREILRLIHEKHPETPCHLLSFGRKEGLQTEVDDELFQACVISGGARGVVHSALPLAESDEWLARLTPLADEIKGLSLRAYREKKLKTLGRERKSLFFETAPEVTGKDILIRLRNLQIKQNLAADDAAAVLSEMERPTTGFADVYGAAAAREELAYIVNWLRNPAKPTVLGLRPPRGILLYGAPGTGKTLLARALAGECKVPFLPVSATSFVTKWQGSGPENIRALFGRARNYAPAIIFIDEIDAIGKERGRGAADNAAEQTLNALLVEMDGFHSAAARPVIVIAATNLVGALDSALRRRFDREIEVDGPDRAARAAYLCRRLLDKPGCQVTETVLNRLAGSTAGRTIAELERIVELAGRMAHSSDNLLTDAIISEACERMLIGEKRPVASREILERVAWHEAGHCLVGWLLGEKPVQINIVSRGDIGGYAEHEAQDQRTIYTKSDIEAQICRAMAGRAAEVIRYGSENGLSSGVASDLRRASDYARMMVTEYGMDVTIGPLALPARPPEGPGALRIDRAAAAIISTQLENAVKLLTGQQEKLEILARTLLEKERLFGAELEALLG